MLERIPIAEFQARTELNPARDLEHGWGNATHVVALKELIHISAIQYMHKGYLDKILRHVILKGGNKARVYQDCTFRTIEISPKMLGIGQRFLEKPKAHAMLANLNDVLRDFSAIGGVLKAGAFIALGKTKDGVLAIAQYVPPIVEKNGSPLMPLLDGIHRNYLVERMEGTLAAIAIDGVKEPFPCRIHSWEEITPVDVKPPPEERYFDLNTDRYRLLNYVGIDG